MVLGTKSRLLPKLFDVRDGESRLVVQSFLVLFMLIAAHTMLETARDALFLTKLPARQLNIVYIALAGLSFFAAAGSTRTALAFGRRNALVASLSVAALATTLLHVLTPTPRVAMALYVFSGLVGAVLSPQFWLLAAELFTGAQGRRLFGPIASGGVLGGVAGAGFAALLLARLPVTSLVLVAAFVFLATALVVTTITTDAEDFPDARRLSLGPVSDATAATQPSLSWSEQPFVWRVGLLVVLSTSAVLAADYLFKSTAARVIPAPKLGEFFAGYYAAMNALSLVVQLVVAGRVVRRLGVAGATAVMPLLLLGGGVASFLSAGALLPVLATRLVDGGLRHSLNRVATELLYLPLPTAVRERAKGLIDTVLARVVQASTAGALFGLGALGILSPRLLAGVIVVLCLGWTGVAFGMRKQYLDLFRRALARGTLSLDASATEIDVNAAEALVEAMASPEPARVIAAMDMLEQRGRVKLIPALVLYHDDPQVIFRALEIFGNAPREDWFLLGERLLAHPNDSVRVAAVRALAKHGVASALERATTDASSAVKGYAAYLVALRSSATELSEHPLLASILTASDELAPAARRALLAAAADAPDPRAVALVLAIARSLDRSAETVALIARAMQALGDPRFIPFCIEQLGSRPGREAIRVALVAIGEPALVALEAALVDLETERHVRTHIPRTIARFGNQRACDFLASRLAEEPDGFVRYKVLRGLGLVVSGSELKVDRPKIEREAQRNLVEHLRTTALRVRLTSSPAASEKSPPASPSEELLLGLLRDKERQALERAFRLLKIAHRREDIHRVHVAATSHDRHARSNASEFLDSLLSTGGQRDLRELFLLVVEDLEPRERVARAARHLADLPADRDRTLALLVGDRDQAVAAFASYYALSLGAETLRAEVDEARRQRPSLDAMLDTLLPSGNGNLVGSTS